MPESEETKRKILAKLDEGIELIKSGYAGVLPTGKIVDRREYPSAYPMPENSLFGIPKPKEP